MGALLADQLQGRPNPWRELVCRKPAYMPPKPLRYLSVTADGTARRPATVRRAHGFRPK